MINIVLPVDMTRIGCDWDQIVLELQKIVAWCSHFALEIYGSF